MQKGIVLEDTLDKSSWYELTFLETFLIEKWNKMSG